MIGTAALARAVLGAGILKVIVAHETLPMPYVGWVPRLGAEYLNSFVLLWVVAALAFLVGYRTRVAGVVLCGCMVYVLLMDEQAYANHLYLLALIVGLLTLGDAGARCSLDARLGRGRPLVPAWPLVLLRCQVTLVYGFSALAKLNPSYLSGDALSAYLRPAIRDISPVVVTAGTVLSLATMLVVASALWSLRLRRVAVLLGAALHVGMVLAIDGGAGTTMELTVFAAAMLSLYTLFFVDELHPGRTSSRTMPRAPGEGAASRPVAVTSAAPPSAPVLAGAAATAPPAPTPPTAPAAPPTAAG